MTTIAFEDGKPVFRDGKVGTGQECCCGSECDCEGCDYSVDIEIEGQTLNVSLNVPSFQNRLFLCSDNGDPVTPPIGASTSRVVEASAYCDSETKKTKVYVRISVDCGDSFGVCDRIVEYNYSFDQCDSEGCATGNATLVSTTDTGEQPGGFGGSCEGFPGCEGGCCDPNCCNKTCFTITAPTSVTINPLP
jgi:hypothetical protein